MADKVLTASPEDPEPIVTPKPLLFQQFALPLSATLLRPSMIFDGGKARPRTVEEQLQLSAEESKGDRWGTSGCHPSSVAMIVEWFRRHPTLGANLTLPFPPDAAEAEASGASYIWKWICDGSGTPNSVFTAMAHPPWIPHHLKNAGDKEWSVNYAEVTATPKSIKHNGVKLSSEYADWSARRPDAQADPVERARRKKILKQALYKCGPLAINMTYPGHYVLLYGYRGDYLYILDPGAIIVKWALLQKDWPMVVKDVLNPKTKKKEPQNVKQAASNNKLVDSATSRVVAQFFATPCDLVIDGEYEFQDLPLSKSKRGPMAFLDCLINYGGYFVKGAGNFEEFLTSPTPGGGASIPPLPPPRPASTTPAAPSGSTTPAAPASGSPSTENTPAGPGTATGAGSQPATTGSSSSSPTGGAAPAGDASSSGGVFSDLWDTLLHRLEQAKKAAGEVFGEKDASAADRKPTGPATPAGPATPPVQARATVTTIDDDTQKGIAGVEVEVVGVDKGKSDAKGTWASRAFDAGTYNVKTRKAGYGPPGSDHAIAEDETTQSVAFTGTKALTVRMRNLSQSRGFIWVLEERSRRRLSNVTAEIVGIDAGPTGADGKWVSKAFSPSKKWVKTRAPGWGPARSSFEGETAQQIDFGRGDTSLVVYMTRTTPIVIPPPDARIDLAELRVSGPSDIDGGSYANAVTFKADPAPLRALHPLSSWTVYDPSGSAIDTNWEPLGNTYDLPPAKVKDCITKKGNDAYGTWTARFARGAYYHDFPFVVAGPMPEIEAPAKNKEPASPSAPPPPEKIPEDFVADGENVDKMTIVNAIDMAHAYFDAIKLSGAVPTRKTVLILTAHWDFETGGGKAMHWFNLGNVKYATGKLAYTRFKCDEWFDAADLRRLEKSPPEQWAYVQAYSCPTHDRLKALKKPGTCPQCQAELVPHSVTRMDKDRGLLTRVWLIPPHDGARFRAFPNLSIGLDYHLKIIRGKKFGKAYDAAVAENVDLFAHELRVAGYYTDSEAVYKAGVNARYAKLDKLITDLPT